MKSFRTRALAVGAAALTLAFGAGAVAQSDASAQGMKGRKAANALVAAKPFQARGIRAAAAYLGLAPKQLRQQLPGTSLAALAAAQGKSVDGLKAAILAWVSARLDKGVAGGRITAEQKAAALAKASARVDKLVARVWPNPVLKAVGRSVPKIVVAETAKALGLTRAQIREQVKGTSLSQLITAAGKSPADVKAAVLARFDARLDRAVANGRLSQARADAALAKLAARVDKALARTRA